MPEPTEGWVLTAEDVIHDAIKTHGHPGSPGWRIERRQAERIVDALRKAGYLIAPARMPSRQEVSGAGT